MYYNCIDKEAEMKYTDHDLIIAQKINLLMDEKLYLKNIDSLHRGKHCIK